MKIRLKELYSNINIQYLYSVVGICLPFIYLPKIVQLDDIIFYEKTSICAKTNKHHFQDNSSKTLYSGLVIRVKFVLVYWKTCPFFMVPTISYCTQAAQDPPVGSAWTPHSIISYTSSPL